MNRYRLKEILLDRMQNMMNQTGPEVCATVCPRLARRKRKLQHYIHNLFEPHIESGRQQRNFQWECVKQIYNTSKNDLDRIWSLRMCCEFVLRLFCTFSCEDHQLITRIIYIYHLVLKEYEEGIYFLGLCTNCKRLNYPRHCLFEERKAASSVLCKINKTTGNTYRFTNRELYSKLTISAIYEGNYVFLKFLVNYGLSCFPDNELEEARLQFKYLFITHYILNGRRLNENELTRKEDFVGSIVRQLFDEKNPYLRRINLILAYVKISIRRRLGSNFYPEDSRCLNLYALTLPEAAVSLEDVQDILNLTFTNDEDFISETLSVFKEVFPDCPSVSSARSLKYLCRCAVRDSIPKSPSLPVVLSDMKIPREVKEYLLFLSN